MCNYLVISSRDDATLKIKSSIVVMFVVSMVMWLCTHFLGHLSQTLWAINSPNEV